MRLLIDFAVAILGTAVIGAMAWGVIWLLSTPYQRYLADCTETYQVVDCHMQWQKDHPFPNKP